MPELAAFLRLATRDRVQLALENIVLRQQLAVYNRSVARPNFSDRDRIFWLTVMRMLRGWPDALVSAPRSPWQNAYVERLIGSIRREARGGCPRPRSPAQRPLTA